MAVNFSGPNLLPAYQTVLEGGDLDWALYTLIGVNELKFVSSGSGGLDEMEDEWSDGKVMWGFVRVKDGNSGLPKFVLINWLGEGVPDSKKGVFPSQSTAVAKFLKGYHISLQARSDADVTPAHIKKRVADSSGSKYSVHNEPAQKYQAPAPVTSSYVPVGRPTITQSRPVAPPTPVGTSYASKQNELAEIRKTQESLIGSRVATAPSTAGIEAPKTMTPPPTFNRPPPPAAAPQPPVVASASFGSSSVPAKSVNPPASSYERPEPVGTSYTPVSLPKPGKLANRWGQPQPTEPESAPSPASRAPISTGKQMTWSERQAAAKKQREEEDAASASAGQQSLGAIPSRAIPAPGAPVAP
ncbi:hypothetical protein P7C70_g8884, partial [Phenoliferia sp. Uapishka_3]